MAETEPMGGSAAEFPTPDVELTHLLVVADAEVSRQWYESVLGATLVTSYGGTSVVMKLQGQWLLLVTAANRQLTSRR